MSSLRVPFCPLTVAVETIISRASAWNGSNRVQPDWPHPVRRKLTSSPSRARVANVNGSPVAAMRARVLRLRARSLVMRPSSGAPRPPHREGRHDGRDSLRMVCESGTLVLTTPAAWALRARSRQAQLPVCIVLDVWVRRRDRHADGVCATRRVPSATILCPGVTAAPDSLPRKPTPTATLDWTRSTGIRSYCRHE